MFRNRKRIGILCAAAPLSWASVSHATILAHESIPIVGTGGSGGSGTSASDMVYAQYQSTDGWGWAGGAGAVQGNAATTNTGGSSNAANEAFNFVVGPTITTLNSTYGAGNWTIANPTFSFNSSGAVQNNSRFGVGSGTFNIFWVNNDNWSQSAGTSTDRQANPIYATDQTMLNTWAGSSSLLGSENFNAAASSSYIALSYALASDSAFENDIVSATSSTDPDLSLYLMGTSNSLGMIIFTGGQGQALPTLSFDVVSVPEPTMLCAGTLFLIPLLKRRSRA